MINILVDEAYAFDYLSILEIKKNKSSKSIDSWTVCYNHLQNQFDKEQWNILINSKEYADIVKANQLTFDAVDKAKNNLVTAKDVDFCNYQRHIAKQSFQKRFFDSELSELKMGYEKYL
jgi:predicted transcriptional regulator